MSSPFPTNETLTPSEIRKAANIVRLSVVIDRFKERIPSDGGLHLGILGSWDVHVLRNLHFFRIILLSRTGVAEVESDLLLSYRIDSPIVQMPGIDSSRRLNDGEKHAVYRMVDRLKENYDYYKDIRRAQRTSEG